MISMNKKRNKRTKNPSKQILILKTMMIMMDGKLMKKNQQLNKKNLKKKKNNKTLIEDCQIKFKEMLNYPKILGNKLLSVNLKLLSKV